MKMLNFAAGRSVGMPVPVPVPVFVPVPVPVFVPVSVFVPVPVTDVLDVLTVGAAGWRRFFERVALGFYILKTVKMPAGLGGQNGVAIHRGAPNGHPPVTGGGGNQ